MAKNVRRFAAFALVFGVLPTHLAIATSAAPIPEVTDSEEQTLTEEGGTDDFSSDDIANEAPSDGTSPSDDTPVLYIKSVNPGYTVSGTANTGEMIELKNSSADIISLNGITLWYSNGTTDYKIYEFGENSFLKPGSLVLRYKKSAEVLATEDPLAVANLVYDKELGLSGRLWLARTAPATAPETETSSTTSDEETIDSICWLGKKKCADFSENAFATLTSSSNITFVRNEEGIFDASTESYSPDFDPGNYVIIAPEVIEPEYEDGDPENPQDSSSAGSSDETSENGSSSSDNPLSDTELDPSEVSDATTVVESTLAPCSEGKYRNPETNRCKNIEVAPEPKTCSEGYYLNEETNRCNKIKEETAAEKTCAEGYHLNPETNRCNKDVVETVKTCEDGHYLNPTTNRCNKLPTEKEYEPCQEGYERNPETNRCRKIATDTEDELKPCAEGYERNPETNRCRKIAANDGADYALVPTTGGTEQTNFVAIWGLVGVGSLGFAYVIFQFRVELAHFFKKFFSRLVNPSRK